MCGLYEMLREEEDAESFESVFNSRRDAVRSVDSIIDDNLNPYLSATQTL